MAGAEAIAALWAHGARLGSRYAAWSPACRHAAVRHRSGPHARSLRPSAERLPHGAGVIYRAFGAADALATGRRLREIARRARPDPADRRSTPPWPRRAAPTACICPSAPWTRPARCAPAIPGWILTGAAHGALGLAARKPPACDAALLSPVFPSRQPVSGRSRLAVERFAALTADAGLPGLCAGRGHRRRRAGPDRLGRGRNRGGGGLVET